MLYKINLLIQVRNLALISLLFLFPSVSTIADPITREQAQQKAEEFLKKCSGSKRLSPVVGKKLSPSRNRTFHSTLPYYVFNRGDNEGYIIIAGDDAIEPALGYTDSGEFIYDEIPDNMRYWLEDYVEYIYYLQNTPNAIRRKVPTHPVISPMLTCNWNQGYPYNNECPMYFTLGRSVTGCVATAMAQVMYHQRSKSVNEVQTDIPGYTTYTSHETYGQLKVDGIEAGSPIDWANMLDNYNNGGNAKQQLAVAQLMYYCGVSVEMDYTNNSSGAQSYKVADALNKYFGYSTAKYVSRSNYTDDTWDALIYNELEQGRVVYLSGANSEAGHAFVTDGYDGNHCYHINWGWGGQSNGHFLLSSLNPSSQGIGGSGDGYNQYQDAVIGCEPDNYGEKELPIANATVKKICLANWDKNNDGKFTYGEAASVTDLGNVFSGQKMTVFTELYYFTGLTSITDNAFNGCTMLNNIKLPKNINSIGEYAFNGCRSLKTFKFPAHIRSIGKAAFAGCRVLPDIEIPSNISEILDSTFAGCAAFTTIDLPISVRTLGSRSFSGCSKLTSFTVHNVTPQNLVLGSSVFEGCDINKATLYTEQGTASYYKNADQWKDFGTIYEERTLSGGNFIELTTNKQVFLFNEGTGKYLSKGEAWGTQAIVSVNEPMRFELRHTTSMPDGVYYLYSNDTGKDGHILFRTSTDTNVGNGVKACFVDGGNSHTSDKSSWWSISSIGNDIYTLQIPSEVSGYNMNQYLGVQPDHVSNIASPTYGVYYDVAYADNIQNCQWRFVEYNSDALSTFEESKTLKNLLAMAKKRSIDVSFEQEIYDDLTSNLSEIKFAQHTLRKKLNFINFKDEELRNVAIKYWDVDGDCEISYSEASKITDFGYNTFEGRSFIDLSDLEYFYNAEYLYGNSFQNCKTLETIRIPKNMTHIYYNVFKGCTKLKSIILPEHISYLGFSTFSSCTALKEVTVLNPNPSKISIGEDLFLGVNLSAATLYVPAGSRELYEKADVWKEFGNIIEIRGRTMPKYSAIEANISGYVYNVDEGKYITNGEAYNTQAVVGNSGLLYQFRRSNSMSENQYYLYSDQAGGSHVLFRTSSDTKVGTGVKACFVDGSLSSSAYWNTSLVGENIYTLQVPSNDSNYKEGEYLGVQTDHTSDFTYETYGLYWDIQSTSSGIHWAFINKTDKDAAEAFDSKVEALAKLLDVAKNKQIDISEEQAVYNNFNSTEEEIINAIATLRSKLHYIDFADSRAKSLCLNNWDTDDDGELSYEEAAAVKDIRTTFRLATNIKSFEELQYFTSLSSLPNDAFYKNTSLTSIYLPSNVKSLGNDAFASCSSLKYIAILSDELVNAQGITIPNKCTIFVPSALVDAYKSDQVWSNCTIKPYTGVPIITAISASKIYGRNNPVFEYEVDGAPINGTPKLTVAQQINPTTGEYYTEAALPVGEYDLIIDINDITSKNLQLINGKITVTPAPLTITARSYTRMEGEENPEFKLSYRTWRNNDTPETAFSVQPVIECDANTDSPAGEYEIRVSGAKAENYDITYVNGILTIESATGIEKVSLDTPIVEGTIYDLQGRKINRLEKGIYIVNGKKVIVR